MRQYYVYIMSNRAHVLYIGVTNDLGIRAGQHLEGVNPGFTRRYHLGRLVYFEAYDKIADAIARRVDRIAQSTVVGSEQGVGSVE